MPMIQLEKPVLTGTMPVVWPTILDLGRDECKRILRKLELEAYAGVISALRAQGDLTKDKKDLLGELTKILGISTERHRAEVRRAVNDERLTTIAYHMSGPNSSSEWSIEGRRLVPLMPRLVPQTAFTVTANAVASATANQNASLLLPAETGNKEVVVCYSYTSTTGTSTSATATSGAIGATVKSPRPPSPSSNVVVLPSGSTVYVKSVSCSDEDEKPRKRRRTNSSSSSPVMLKEVSKVMPPVSKNITVPVSSPKMSNIMQSIANSLPPHLSPVKITFTKPTIQTTNTTTQKVIIVTTSPSSNFVPNILSKSHAHNNAALSKLVSTSMLTATAQKQTVVFPASASTAANTVAVTTMVSSTPSVVMSTTCASSAGVKMASARLPSPKTLMGSPAQILAQFPKQQSPKQLQHSSAMGVCQTQTTTTSPGSKPTIQIKQESGVKIITQQVQPSKILPKPSSVALSSSSSSPIMVVSSNGAIMTTKLVTQSTATQATYTRPTVSPSLGARISASGGGTTYVKTTSGSIITVVPKSLATLGGKIISSNIVSGTTTKITTIPMTSKPNVIVVQKTTGKGATIQGLPGKNVVTTLLNAGVLPKFETFTSYTKGEKGLQAVQGTKPAIITASRPITKMIVTQPKGMSSGSQATATKIIPTKIVYGQQGKTQVLIKPKPVFQTAVVSEQTRQLVTEALQHVTRSAELAQSQAMSQDGSTKDDSGSLAGESSHSGAQEPQPVVHVMSSREHDWTEQEISVESSPTIIYQEVSAGDSQSAASTIKALLELQQTAVKEKAESKPRQHTIDLSQMAVPLQLAQEKKPSPESPRPSTSEAEPSTEYVTAGKVSSRVGGVPSEDDNVVMSSSQQLGKPYKICSQVTVVTKPAATVASAAAATHVSHVPSDSHGKSDTVLEVGELEGDTLDPQTGLFYRSSQPATDPVRQTPHSAAAQPPPSSQAEAEQSRLTSTSTSVQPPPQLQSKPQISQPSSSSAAFPSTLPLTKKLPKLREQIQPKPQALTLSPKDRPLTAPAQVVAKVMTPSTPTKPLLTPQLPKLQQAPTSHHRPLHTPMSHPPPLQAHHPVSTEKTTSSQPIITQSATVTKITFGGSHHSSQVFSSGEATAKLIPESSSRPSGDKPSVSDILKISMMEAEIDPSTEPMVVDSSSDCGPLGKALEVQAVSGTLDSGQFISSSGASMHHPHTKSQQFSCMQGLTAQRSKEDLEVIEVIPQYSILPDSSQSNVVVEPSGFLEITNYTSQQLEEDSPMEQEVDSSNDEAAAASPPTNRRHSRPEAPVV
ncbi:BRCA2-interacting transcriptional repressor EMSY isoform X2 [Anoplopoma fimbria]|uniref:BRCA2-interacting transcriptional repressor EMSY isoform X2 n=1 Tax=Anoplopoma fimbria TaxID=229290 RepID=UPI0023EBE7BD|nr:BRCA2-interacting transcriptional repressor EMSY isoform X2 [Anoplopoma fimbria]